VFQEGTKPRFAPKATVDNNNMLEAVEYSVKREALKAEKGEALRVAYNDPDAVIKEWALLRMSRGRL